MISEYDPFTFLNSSFYSHILARSTYYHSDFDLMGVISYQEKLLKTKILVIIPSYHIYQDNSASTFIVRLIKAISFFT